MIGLGRIGYTYQVSGERASHVSSYLKCPRTELVAVADTDQEKLEAFKKEYPEIAVYESYEKMLYEVKPEILSVAVPTNLHHRVVRNSCRFHNLVIIFVEKPISSTVEEAEKMIRTCEQFQVKLAVNHTRRWDPAYQRVKQIVEGKDEAWSIGELLMFEVKFSGDPINDGVHAADLGLWMTNGKTDKINLLSVPSSWLVFEVDLWGSNGLIRIFCNGLDIELWFPYESVRYSEFKELGPAATLEETYDFSKAMLSAVDDLVECASSDKQPECTGKDGLEALKLCLERF